MKQPRVAFIGEAYGAEEAEASAASGKPAPFIGASGKLLDALLKVVDLRREDCLLTNVFNMRPKDNDLANILGTKKAGLEGWPPVRRGLYLPESLLPELERLYAELTAFAPDLIIALGSPALWSLTGKVGISNRHGFLHHWRGIPVIPTYHPASILRKYTQFMPAANDIRRGVGFAAGSIQEESFSYCDAPGLADIKAFQASIAAMKPKPWLSVDIETKPKFRAITCIGLGTSAYAICIPFWDPARPGQSYWASASEELEALGLISEILEDQQTTKILQNAAYDITWIKAIWGIGIAGPTIDTRLMHFALYPELPHSLAEIASTYLTMMPWKAIHTFGDDKAGDKSGSTDGE